MCPLKQCFCCISLRAGTLFIGLLYLVWAGFSLAILFAAIVFRFDSPDMNSMPFLEVFPVYYLLSAIALSKKVIILYLLAFCCLQIIIDIILIIGAAQRKAAFAVPWLVLNIFSLLSNLLGIVAFCTDGFVNQPNYINGSLIGPVLVAILYLAVGTYTMMVVTSFYQWTKRRYEVLYE